VPPELPQTGKLSLNDEQVAAISARCASSIEAHCKVFYSSRFHRPFTKAHHKLFEVIDDSSAQLVLVLAYRGFGKTSFFNYALPSQYVTFRKGKFIVQVSRTADQALWDSENLKKSLRTSPLFHYLIGDIKDKEMFSQKFWIGNGVGVMPRGADQKHRGWTLGDYRPDLIILDDFEDDDEINSPEQREKYKERFHASIAGMVDVGREDWRIVVVGTPLHEDSLLEDLRADSSWVKVEFPLCDEGYKSFYPQHVSDEKLAGLVHRYRTSGREDVFAREYMLQIVSKETAVFRREYFKYYDEGDVDFYAPGVDTAVVVDPSKGGAGLGAYSGIVGVSVVHREGMNRIYVRDCIRARVQNDELYLAAFELAERLGTPYIAVEKTGLDMFLTKPFVDAAVKYGYGDVEFIWLTPKRGQGPLSAKSRGKDDRIGALGPYYRMGHVYHNAAVCGDLEQELLMYPRSKYKDLSDALAYVIQLCDIGGKFFSPESQPKEMYAHMRERQAEAALRRDVQRSTPYKMDYVKRGYFGPRLGRKGRHGSATNFIRVS